MPQNKFIEIKSNWTFDLNEERNMTKFDACKKLGYEIEIRIYSPKGECIKTIK